MSQYASNLSGMDEEIREQGGLLKTEDHRFQMKVYETVELLQDICPFLQADSEIRRSVAEFGEVYLFFNQTGELCFLTDFVRAAK